MALTGVRPTVVSDVHTQGPAHLAGIRPGTYARLRYLLTNVVNSSLIGRDVSRNVIGRCQATAKDTCPGARFTKYLTIHHTIIVSLS